MTAQADTRRSKTASKREILPTLHQLRDEVAVVGWSCRLPGANSVSALWSLLLNGQCAVSRVPTERFSQDRFFHPRRQERGKSYTFAAGVLEDIWGFDPAVFGISPREAEQMDPQQRLLLQLTWEALEDAGIVASSIAGSDVGVFVGGSLTDYSNALYGDPALGDSHFATGNALACLSNRISYSFDLKGPSLTIDTACSSSLVALHQACEALRSGRIDTAIVGGVNVIASPLSFISFSQASMLSPDGLCQAFDASANGFVRGEGGIVLVLRKAALASARRNPIHGTILASDVNSDGRTNGISLPSGEAQEELLNRVYARANIAPDRLAFVEAHGTGTPVGDPIEATALGRSLGRVRDAALPIGSIKTNIGHLEPASGLAGLLKAMLALNHGLLPPSLHYKAPNPNINFDELKLTVCNQSLLLPDVRSQCAGVNSFGFGGTNAHVVVGPGRRVTHNAVSDNATKSRFFAISAETKPALADLAKRYGEQISARASHDVSALAGAAAYRRERMSHHLVVSSTERDDVLAALEAFRAGKDDHRLFTSSRAGTDLPAAFVFSGNGSQRVGMGISAYSSNKAFAERFDEIDTLFQPLSGWSLKEMMFSETLADMLPLTSIAQPLIFAIQSASTYALMSAGLRPTAVLGHSVGEIAAAEAAGILHIEAATKVIYFRSKHQELVKGSGGMAAVAAPPDTASRLAQAVGDVELAALNSPRAVTVAGSHEALARFKDLAVAEGIAFLPLALDYPFHTSLMAPVEQPLRNDLAGLNASEASIPFISTVTGKCLTGRDMDAGYWWHNVRDPVCFVDAVREATKLGVRAFVEIGPSSVLLKHITDSASETGAPLPALCALNGGAETGDPFDRTVASAYGAGIRVDETMLFGSDPGSSIQLPTYPWQQKAFRFTQTPESVEQVDADWHPFAGTRRRTDAPEWYSQIDTDLFPELADHKVGELVLFPGAAFLEMGLSIARQWLRSDTVSLANFEILSPLTLTGGDTYEIVSRISPSSNVLEIMSRRRFSKAGWVLNARVKMSPGRPRGKQRIPSPQEDGEKTGGDSVYRIANRCGLHYGPSFRLADHLTSHGEKLISVELKPANRASDFVLDPMRVDASIHGMISKFPKWRAAERGVAYVPVRLDEALLFAAGSTPQRALIKLTSETERSIVADFYLFDRDDELVAVIRGARCQAIAVRRSEPLEAVATVMSLVPADAELNAESGIALDTDAVIEAVQSHAACNPTDDFSMLLEGWATAAASELAASLTENGAVAPARLVVENRLPPELLHWLIALLNNLAEAGLAQQVDEGTWKFDADAAMPSSAAVIAALAAEHPSRAKEILLASEVSAFVARVADAKSVREPFADILTPAAFEFSNVIEASWANLHGALSKAIMPHAPAKRTLRVLQIGTGPLALEIAASGAAAVVTIVEPDQRRAEAAAIPKRADIMMQTPDVAKLGTYDLIVAVDALRRLPSDFGLAELRRMVAPEGLFVAIERRPGFFADLVFGLRQSWFENSIADFPVGPLKRLGEWKSALARAEFSDVKAASIQSGSEEVSIVVAAAPEEISHAAPSHSPALAPTSQNANGDLAAALADLDEESAGETPVIIRFIPGAMKGSDAVDALVARCMAMKRHADSAPPRSTLWLVFIGALDAKGIDPVSSGAWSFSRTLANEFAQLDIRRIDVAPGLSPSAAVTKVREIVASGTAETELRIDADDVRRTRADTIRRVDMSARPKAEAARLQRTQTAGARLQWKAVDRKAPADNEIEIAVEATGMNFRDLMWTLGLLPDDILENGFTGPTLGLECAGRVIGAGAAVKNVKPGDRVMAFAPASFSTHITVDAKHALPLPQHLSFDAAATIPVAFLTAHYSLITQAKLRRGETVLIHGGAGGVGLAAIQVAQARGAKVIATAGSKAKRHLLHALGVEHVFDSRSTSFVDGVREVTGNGVDVVLNSLAGEPMEQSIACLAPFGRFVELGKRDFVMNSQIGLRAFRNNVSYFSVDVDQILARRGVAEAVLRDVSKNLQNGKYIPLPYTAFPSTGASEALSLLQQSAHIGKIVVHPPRAGEVMAETNPFKLNESGTHVVTGAFGGFGTETVRWLVERGARHLVLLGRKGAASEEAQELLRDLAAQGVRVICEPCDVSDASMLGAIFDRAHLALPPIVGIIHAAMVLDDCILDNLTPERMRSVLVPKVKGIDNLDALSRGLQLDYFVAFSSVTTLIGNPGQGNYVAANAYMEGLIRKRRAQGLPGLAVGWGPITDVGVVARSQKLRAGLEKLTGARGMTAREALDLMAQAIAKSAETADLAVMTIAPNNGSFGAARLSVLSSPTYSALINPRSGDAAETAFLDLPALLQSEEPSVAARKVSDLIVDRLSRVLHSPPEDISRVRPLAEIGLDSLMALELGINLQEALGFRLTLSGSAGQLTVSGLADEIIAQATGRAAGELRDGPSAVASLAKTHAVEIDAEQLQSLERQVRQKSEQRALP